MAGAALLLAGVLPFAPAALTPVALFAPQPALAATAPPPGLSAKDRQTGAEAYPEIVREFGGTVEGPLADYVRGVALRIAMVSAPGSTPADWRVTVLDSPIPNAMATPGGYLYITRGLLAMINNEAELASVLGHEAGHVAARHANKRNSRATIGTLGSIAAAILLGNEAANIVNTGASAWVAGYSRSQENQADSLGMHYAAAAGYDPMAAATMLQALDRVATVEGQQEERGANSIFSTHPVTAERVQRVAAEARAMKQGGATNASAYLRAINGMTYGDASNQGVISGTSFRHAGLGLGFTAPTGFVLQNRPEAVSGSGPDGAQFQFSNVRAPGQAPADVAQDIWRQITGAPLQTGFKERRINQFDAATGTARVRASNGRQADLGLTVYRAGGDDYYVLRTLAPAGKAAGLQTMPYSVRTLDTAERNAAGNALHIAIRTVAASDSTTSLAARMAAPYNQPARFLALNGLAAGQQPRAGAEVKLIVR